MRKCANIYQYMRRPLVIYDFANNTFWISLYVRKILFHFLSVQSQCKYYENMASSSSLRIIWKYGLPQQFAYNVKIRPLAAEYKRPIDPLQLCYWPNKFNVSRHEPINGSDRIWVLPKESKEPSGPATYGLEGSQPYITFIIGLYLLYLCLYEYA